MAAGVDKNLGYSPNQTSHQLSRRTSSERLLRNVLIVAYHSPPDPRIGALRPVGLVKYFRQFGWEPHLLTAAMGGAGREQLKQDYSVFEVPPFDMMLFLRHPMSAGVTADEVRYQTPRLTASIRSKEKLSQSRSKSSSSITTRSMIA